MSARSQNTELLLPDPISKLVPTIPVPEPVSFQNQEQSAIDGYHYGIYKAKVYYSQMYMTELKSIVAEFKKQWSLIGTKDEIERLTAEKTLYMTKANKYHEGYRKYQNLVEAQSHLGSFKHLERSLSDVSLERDTLLKTVQQQKEAIQQYQKRLEELLVTVNPLSEPLDSVLNAQNVAQTVSFLYKDVHDRVVPLVNQARQSNNLEEMKSIFENQVKRPMPINGTILAGFAENQFAGVLLRVLFETSPFPRGSYLDTLFTSYLKTRSMSDENQVLKAQLLTGLQKTWKGIFESHSHNNLPQHIQDELSTIASLFLDRAAAVFGKLLGATPETVIQLFEKPSQGLIRLWLMLMAIGAYPLMADLQKDERLVTLPEVEPEDTVVHLFPSFWSVVSPQGPIYRTKVVSIIQ
ncbi:hypothetical protein EDD86DRAFT_211408 [Gorgonomyces haynaldii]|nr:hypothetical protein EDD86DRAFT_211408 [Gorgonomyces haynaldii]